MENYRFDTVLLNEHIIGIQYKIEPKTGRGFFILQSENHFGEETTSPEIPRKIFELKFIGLIQERMKFRINCPARIFHLIYLVNPPSFERILHDFPERRKEILRGSFDDFVENPLKDSVKQFLQAYRIQEQEFTTIFERFEVHQMIKKLARKLTFGRASKLSVGHLEDCFPERFLEALSKRYLEILLV